MMRHGCPYLEATRSNPLLIDDKKRPSCMDQFDRIGENEHLKDDWIEKLSVRLLALLNRVAGRL